MNSALSSHSESIPKFIHNASLRTSVVAAVVTRNPHYSHVLLRFLRRRLFLSLTHIFGEERELLDDHRLIARKNLFHKLVISETMIARVIGHRENLSTRIRKPPTAASFHEHDVTLRLCWKKQSGIDLLNRLSE